MIQKEVKTKVITVPRGTSILDALGLPPSTPMAQVPLAKPIVIKNGEMIVEVLV